MQIVQLRGATVPGDFAVRTRWFTAQVIAATRYIEQHEKQPLK
jgi:hypothetical protein